MIRLFTGISLPQDIRRELSAMQHGVDDARWALPENFHITLTFVGQVDEPTAEDIDDILSGIQVPSFTLQLKGAGYFAKGHSASHLWMGVKPSESLQHLKKKIDTAFHNKRIPFSSHERFVPHVTVARLKRDEDEQVAGFVQANNLYQSRAFKVGEMTLYQSYQTKKGSMYEEKVGYPLA